MQTLSALIRGTTLCAPQVGVWSPSVRPGDAVEGGRPLGTLRVLGRRIVVVAPVRASGEVVRIDSRGPVAYAEVLLELGTRSAGRESAGAGSGPEPHPGGHAVRSPIDGIFYRRSTPDAPNFVEVGDVVTPGQTLGLVEVMKTFNPIRSDVSGRIVAFEAGEQQEVSVGAVLVVIARS
jgi:biotin carboxyl carrier protein